METSGEKNKKNELPSENTSQILLLINNTSVSVNTNICVLRILSSRKTLENIMN